MNERTLRIGNVAAAVVVIGGILLIARPQYALGIVQLVIASIAAAAALHALAASVPPTGWLSPFKWMSPFNRAVRTEEGQEGWDEVASLRSKLSGRRQPMRHAPPMPPEIVRLLKPLIRQTLDLDPNDETQLASARRHLSPLAWGLLTSEPPTGSPWFRALRPNEREVAEVVHRVLDELDRLAAGGFEARRPSSPDSSRAP